MAAWDPVAISAWLLREGHRLENLDALNEALATRLVAAGLPLVRLRVSMRILHPLILALSAVWERGVHLDSQLAAGHGLEQFEGYRGSPLEIVGRTQKPFRRRLESGLEESDHRTLHRLAEQGATDYLALPMMFRSGRFASLAAVTDRAGGFSEADVAGLEQVAATLCPIAESMAAYRMAESVADAYIGPRSGRRVLEGQIRRGDVETLRAAIWLSDMRGWSRLANSLPAAEAVALANGYFELVEGAVDAAGGEVLKLIGDAVLAIFPVGEGGDAAACGSAVTAALAALAKAPACGEPGAFGIGLHIGELIYGNVGTPTRLDFTVMGRAVNLAARLEALTKTLDRPVILSEELAHAAGVPCSDLGPHSVVGWDEPVRVFAPDEGPVPR